MTQSKQRAQKDRAKFFAECVFFSPKKTKMFAPFLENAPKFTWGSGWREPATVQRAQPSPPSLRAAARRPLPRRVGVGPHGPASPDTAWLPGSFSTRKRTSRTALKGIKLDWINWGSQPAQDKCLECRSDLPVTLFENTLPQERVYILILNLP